MIAVIWPGIYMIVACLVAWAMLRFLNYGEDELTVSYAFVSGVLWPLAATMMISHLIICLVMILPHRLFTGNWPWEA